MNATRALLGVLGFVALLGALGGSAEAYPQFQMSRDQTCTGCHVSPAGGGMLNENGLGVSETISKWGTAPEFFYGKVPTPSWLALGGDLRGASGYIQAPEKQLASFPMQLEAYAHATLPKGFSLYLNLGSRSAEVGNEASTHAWSREHYLMWQRPGESDGLFIRAGRFMPVFGLRIAEHPSYVRKWGGTPLYADTYALAIEYIKPKFEIHATGFIKDPLINTPEHSDGGALLAEYRASERFSFGGEAMYTKSDDESKVRGGLLAKYYLPSAETLLLFEGQYVYQDIPPRGAPNQVVAYLMASKALGSAYMVDLGLGYYNQNIRITELHREAVDLNFHWFASSHVEAILTGRFEMLAFGEGGPSAGYALAQLHYRL